MRTVPSVREVAARSRPIRRSRAHGLHLLGQLGSDPDVVALGYVRLSTILPAYVFSLFYEILSGYLRGFGISLVPAVLTMLGVCGIRIAWVQFVFPQSATFRTLMTVYPVSLTTTALLMTAALLIYRPTKRFTALQRKAFNRSAE